MDLQSLKNHYDIVGNDQKLLFALNKAIQVAPTDLSILINGESGVGKDVFSRIIHENSLRKHVRKGKGLISVNCGAIPEGTIESELFGHVKGAFTGADKDRKGYFEEADGGTIFLDEVGELPLAMQVKLLRVLENGEIIPVGSSIARKVDVRVVAATNADMLDAVHNGKFRDDLYYRLNQISIYIPPLRERREDIPLLFRKFASDVAEKYNMPPIFLNDEARCYLMDCPWYGNIRELKNLTEQISIVETERDITLPILRNYLNYVPEDRMPTVMQSGSSSHGAVSDRELLLKALSMGQMINEMRGEINELRQALTQLAQNGTVVNGGHTGGSLVGYGFNDRTHSLPDSQPMPDDIAFGNTTQTVEEEYQEPKIVEEETAVPLALEDRERHAIKAALQRHNGHRHKAAEELHISERTLYRKIKEYGL